MPEPKPFFTGLLSDKDCRSRVNDQGGGNVTVIFQCQRDLAGGKTAGQIAICYFVGAALSSCMSVTGESN